MQHIKEALRSFVKKEGLDRGIQEQKAVSVWPEVVGENISANSLAKSISSGILVVEVSNAVWRQELQLQKNAIIEKINKVLTRKTIKDIRFL